MRRSSLVVLVTKQTVSVKIKDVTTMTAYNIGDVDAVFNGATLKAGGQKEIVVADGTLSDVDIDVKFSDNALEGYEKKVEIIYRKIIPLCAN